MKLETELAAMKENKSQIRTHKNYDSKHKWKKAANDLWFKGDKAYGYNELEGQPGVYRYNAAKLPF